MNEFRIGDLSIERQDDGSIWLRMVSGDREGEAMQTSEIKLYAALMAFYAQEF